MKGRPLLIAVLLLILIFAVIYAAAVGPYWKISPDSSSYVLGARSLARGEGYTIDGRPVQLFPPLTSMIFSVFLRLSPDNYRLLNGLITFFALASLFLFWRLLCRSVGDFAGLVIVLLSIGSSLLFHQKTFLLSDIFYMFFSVASLLALENFIGGKSRWWVLAGGGALLCACMARVAGIALLGALLACALLSLAGGRSRRAEGGGRARAPWLALAAVLPLLFIVLWSIWSGRVGVSYVEQFLQKVPYAPEAGQRTLLDMIVQLFSNLKKMLRPGEMMLNGASFDLLKGLALARFIGTGLFFWGLFLSLKKKLTLAALYTVFYLLLIEILQADEGFRFFIPVLPMFFFYAWTGLKDIGSRLRRRAGLPVRKAAAVLLGLYVLLYLAVGMRDMLRMLPEELRSPFQACPVKYEANYDAERAALWLRDHTPSGTRYVCQHADMWDIVTGRNGFEFLFSSDHNKVMEHLRSNRIEYVLIDKKKTPVKMFLAPVLLAYPSEFELVMEAKRASLYKVLNPP